MKVRMEIVDELAENEIVIRCRQMDDEAQRMYRWALSQTAQTSVVFYKESNEYYFPLSDVLFFETEKDCVYAHTRDDAYRVKLRLYELEGRLPRDFVRISKSAVVNVRQVHSLQRNLAGASLVQFRKSHKAVYASRLYFKDLRARLEERRNYEK